MANPIGSPTTTIVNSLGETLEWSVIQQESERQRFSIAECATHYHLNPATVRSRSRAHKWLLIDGRRKQQLSATGKRSLASQQPTGAISPEEIEKHTRNVFNLGIKSLGKVKNLRVRTPRDFEIVDKVVRRAAGIDEDAPARMAVLIGVNERFEEHATRRATVVEVQPSSPTTLQQGNRVAELPQTAEQVLES